MMPVGNRPAYNSNANPPELKFQLLKTSNLPNTSIDLSEAKPPVDILLFTVEDCEFLSCFSHLEEPFRSYHKDIGFVYVGYIEKMKIALMRCSKGPDVPRGSLSTAKDAILLLRPKATISVGACSGLDNGKVKLGDVVISSLLITADHKIPPSTNFMKLIKGMADGWKAPLQNADEYVKVHCDGVVLSVPKANEHIIRQHPDAFAVETEGGGLFTASFDFKMEWLVVRGIKDIRGKKQFSNEEKWKEVACVMAASLVAHNLRDSIPFKDWPNLDAETSRLTPLTNM
ncbi:hypothetical protein AWC38_SpisGene14756 [Stylophora pistillata]|uniref:Nucleoside phosphorylase domain-containing protein n=2 Tax=Stylophora pistillata TaxID=50429 RepID=A0A2B4RQR3_STYPI|nr:hypothetical protein AWC38_SpisGene14756 [Stylophora pistillata]